MADHPIQGLMATALENLKDMIDVNTIIGDPIETPDGSTVILPVSRVGFGFAAGGSEFNGKGSQSSSQSSSDSDSSDSGSSGGGSLPFGGGSGGGVSISPVAFLIVNQTGIKMVHLDEHAHLYERLLDLAPQAVQKIDEMFQTFKKGGKKQDKNEKRTSSEEKNKEKRSETDRNESKEDNDEKPPPMKL